MRQDLRGKELLYGASPTRNGPIVYSPDVIFLGGGANAIRSVSADGMIWTIDGSAPHADEIQVGKILFATTFGAGRVLGVETLGRDKRVAIGPAPLTDIISDADIATTKPIGLVGFHAYQVPTQPGAITDARKQAAPTLDVLNASIQSTNRDHRRTGRRTFELATQHYVGELASNAAESLRGINHEGVAPDVGVPNPAAFDPARLPAMPTPSADIPSSEIGRWHVDTGCCTSVGVHVAYDYNGARVGATAQLRFDAPSLNFELKISHKKVINASVTLRGAASLSFDISAAIEASKDNFNGGRVQVPVEIAIPIPIGNLPVVVGVQEVFSVDLGLGGRAALSTSGEYSVSGALGFSVRDGVPHADIPQLNTVKSALDSVQSIAVAPSALIFGFAVKVSIGVGPPNLSASVWYKIAATLALATSGSQIDQLQGTSLVSCKSVKLVVDGTFGVGYRVPELVAAAVNFFLKSVFSNPVHFDATGGKSWPAKELFERHTPPCTK